MALRLSCMLTCSKFSCQRYVSTTNKTTKPLYKRDEAKKFRFYIVNRYVEFLMKYETAMEKRFPSAMRVYRMFMDGIKLFYKDVKDYLKIVRSLNKKENKLMDLTRTEIELYYQMPKDMVKVAPILILSLLPFANYVIFPLAYFFPRHLLCSHFWNLQQKAEFRIMILQQRLIHNRPVFRHLQAPLPQLKDNQLYDKWNAILASLGSGSHPTTEEILACKKLFMGKPFHLFYLRSNHVKHLLLMHDMHRVWFRRSRLAERAAILIAIDRAILREGGLESMSTEALRKACLMRGLNPLNMKKEHMINWLLLWLTISNEIDKYSYSLLLHCPILLAYNHPTNWQLIYRSNK
ncbi:LETM1-like, RBD [Popillia japonica]|uniref:LETM1-like, RBD n=1 Tax=Popillia japonica TaxID=7064 RepID=A0AAW1L144_POPJA